MVRTKYLSPVIFYLLFTCLTANAQVSTANVIGIVEDSTKARIPEAEVKLINTQTGTENDGITDSYGTFVLSAVIPGTYLLQIEKDGFATAQLLGIVLNLGDTKQLLIRLSVGSVDQTVSVDGSGMTLNTTDASISTIIDRKFVANLPLNGRSFQDLISMTPGIQTQSPQEPGPGDFSVNGQRPDVNAYTVDGVSGDIGTGSLLGHRKFASTGRYAGTTALGTTQGLVSIDELQEFRVFDSSYPAEYGRTSGGQFTLLTRSGTNAFHASAYALTRNDAFDAKDWYDGYNKVNSYVSFHQQEFGGTFGGPIPLGKMNRAWGKTFFFASYERLLKGSQPGAALIVYVPDYPLHQEVPPPLQAIINIFPTSGVYYSGSRHGLDSFSFGSLSLPGHFRATSIRLDHNFTPKLSSFLRVDCSPSDVQSRYISSLSNLRTQTRTFTFGATAQLATNQNNEFRLGFAQSNSRSGTKLDYDYEHRPNYSSGPTTLGASDLNRALGIPATYMGASSEFYIRIPGVGESFANTESPSGSITQWNIRDTYDFQTSHHFFRFGIDYRKIASRITPPSVSLETNFLSRASIVANSASSVTITKNSPATPAWNEFSAFAQDDWRVSQAVTLSLGLRWDVNPAPGKANGQAAYTVLGVLQSPTTLRLAPRGTSLWQTGWYNFAPRLGVAWAIDRTPGKELVLRGGGGVFFDTANQAAVGAFSAVGFSATSYSTGLSIPIASPKFDFDLSPISSGVNTIAYAFPRHLQLPYALHWNIALEKALGKRQTVTTAYVGSAGRRLLQSQFTQTNVEDTNISEVYYFPRKITSNYQALQLKFQRSISPGLQVLTSYALSHALDYGSTNPAFSLARGNSDYDVRHNYQLGLSWDAPTFSRGLYPKYLENGWGIDGRLLARSAFPVTPQGNLFIDPATGERYYSSVDLVPGDPLYLKGSQFPGGRIFNGGPHAANPAFQLPKGSDPGNLPRNMLRGFGAWQVNIGLRKDIDLYRDVKMQLKAEVFNITNHPDLGYIDPHLSDDLFGQATLMLNQSFGESSPLYQQGAPRSIQLSMRFSF